MTQIKKNFIYNMLYQILIIILPIITVPYVSRVLGAEGIGTYSYTYSIVNYFMLIAMLGINNYGNRSIAKARDNKKELSKTFLSIYLIQIFMSLLMIVLYLGYILIFNNSYKTIALIQGIYLISVIFDINWFFFGLEKFKITVTRSTVLKILSLILIFTFVKTSNDVWIYTIILSGSTLLSQLLLIPFLKKEIDFVKITFKDIKNHIKPCLILFIPVISVSLYKIMDKIMLGNMSNILEVGYYEQAEKITTIPLGIITALGTVMLPRISNLVAKKDKKKILDYIEKSIKFMMFLSIPLCFGIIAVADKFVPLFLGNSFQKSILLLKLLSVTTIFISFANITKTQYLIPYEMDKDFTISTIIGAFLNLLINYLLIPKYQAVGACIGTIIAEFSVMAYQIISLKKQLPFSKYFKICFKYILQSIFMFIVIILINYMNISNIYKMILQIICGISIYTILNYKYILSLLRKENKNESTSK